MVLWFTVVGSVFSCFLKSLIYVSVYKQTFHLFTLAVDGHLNCFYSKVWIMNEAVMETDIQQVLGEQVFFLLSSFPRVTCYI